MRRISLVSLASFALAGLASTLGCSMQPAAGEEATGQASEAISYFPLGFARVGASGAIVSQFNSVTGGGVSTIHGGVGRYTVRFDLLASGWAGHAQISAEGQGSERCRLLSWTPSGSTQLVDVQCNRPDGTPADSAFAVTYFRYVPPTTHTTSTSAAYVWVTGGAAPTAPAAYNYNGSGALNTVTHAATGTYVVTLPNAAAQNASLMVTAYGGSGAPFCQIGSWSALGYPATATRVNVSCRSTTGALADGDFALSYSTSGPTLYQQGGHAWFDGATANASYSAAMPRSCWAASVTGSRSGNLANVVLSGEIAPWDASPLRRASFVSAYGYTASYCKVTSLTSTTTSTSSSTSTSTVRCFDGAGTEIAPTFTFTQLTSDANGPC